MGRRRCRGGRRTYFALSSCLLAELRACSSHVHARSRRLPSICPHLPLSPSRFPFRLLISLTAFCTLYTFLPPPPISFSSLSSALNSFRSFCPLILMILSLSSLLLSLCLCISVSHAVGTDWVCLPDCPPGIAAGTQKALLCRPAGQGWERRDERRGGGGVAGEDEDRG